MKYMKKKKIIGKNGIYKNKKEERVAWRKFVKQLKKLREEE